MRSLVRLVLVAVCMGTAFNSVATYLLWQSNRSQVTSINEERAQNVQRNCEDVNRRHDSTIAALDRLLAKRLPSVSPGERARLNESRQNTVLLIEALVPKRDCARLTRQQVSNP